VGGAGAPLDSGLRFGGEREVQAARERLLVKAEREAFGRAAQTRAVGAERLRES
jgi:hypothetical protein